ncbi:MAG: pantetheine-phosphate adenylyltransferase [Anaerolineae bacterium]|nr:pantetheine-phosphate adenylyltransferase [Anaerolineae bacterium]
MRRAVYPGSFNLCIMGTPTSCARARVFDELVVAVYDRPEKPHLFSVEERLALIVEAVEHLHLHNIKVASYSGLTVNYVKDVDAFVIVRGLRVFSDFEFEFRMALANHRLAPDIEVVNFIASEETVHLSSSTVREIASLGGDVSSMVPPHVASALQKRYSGVG